MSTIAELSFTDRDLEVKAWAGPVRRMTFELSVSHLSGDVEWAVGCVRLELGRRPRLEQSSDKF